MHRLPESLDMTFRIRLGRRGIPIGSRRHTLSCGRVCGWDESIFFGPNVRQMTIIWCSNLIIVYHRARCALHGANPT